MMSAASVLVRGTFSQSLSLPTPEPPAPTHTFLSLPGTRVPTGLYGLSPSLRSSHALISHSCPLRTIFLYTASLRPSPLAQLTASTKMEGTFFQKHSHSTRSPFVTLLSRCAQSGRWSPFGKLVRFTELHTVLIIYLYLFYFLNLLLIKWKKSHTV